MGFRRLGLIRNRLCFLIQMSSIFLICGCAQNESQLFEVPGGKMGTHLFLGESLETTWMETGRNSKDNFEFQVRVEEKTGISYGIAVDGPHPKDVNTDKLFIPASITKVFTSAMILEEFGEHFAFSTKMSWEVLDGGKIANDPRLTANGDPQVAALSSATGPERARLKEISEELVRQGIREVTGELRLISEDKRLDVVELIEGADLSDSTACFGALSQAFNFQRNCAEFKVSGLSSGEWFTSAIDFPFSVQLAPAATTSIGVSPVVNSQKVVESFVFKGSYNSNQAKPVFRLPLPDVRNWYAAEFRQALRIAGIKTDKLVLREDFGSTFEKDRTAEVPRVQYIVYSSTAEVLVRFMNKVSDNFIADSLFKILAIQTGEQNLSLREAGIKVMQKMVGRWLSLALHSDYNSEVRLHDGAGLSRTNLISPRAYLTVLKQFVAKPYFKTIWESLSIAGKDGTLKNRMKGTIAEGLVRAKTGTLRGAYQLAGYIPRMAVNGVIFDYIPFVILSSTTPENEAEVRDFQDKLVVKLTKELNPHL